MTLRSYSKPAEAPPSPPPHYVRAFADQARAYMPGPYTVLGTDGLGRSNTRTNLRRHFERDRFRIAHAAIAALAAEGKMMGKYVARAIKLYKIDGGSLNPIEARQLGVTWDA